MREQSYWQKVYEVTKQIPVGRVSTYGAIAEYLALGSARMVGWALNHVHGLSDVPAHRVVNSVGFLSGRLMFPTATIMQERLEAEGVMIVDDKVKDFKNIFWHPSEMHLGQIDEADENVLVVTSLIELDAIADMILERTHDYDVVLFRGDLGAGKTTTIKAIGKQMGIDDLTSSPTFSIINEYETIEGETVYHMDLYRLNSTEEALDIGIEEYLFSGRKCFIEWPDVILPLLDRYATINIIRTEVGNRKINITFNENQR